MAGTSSWVVGALLSLLVTGCARAPEWQSGFERGFPGEWLDYDRGANSPDGAMPANRVAAWTIVQRASGEPVFSGDHAYKGWIAGPAAGSHRAYPMIHVDLATPLVNSFMVYLKADYARMGPRDWIHFGTWGNHDPATAKGLWALHTLSVRNRKLEFAHTSPFSGEYLGAVPQPDFPLDRWVRLTAYLHYRGPEGYVQVWQDGLPVLRAGVPQLAGHPGTRLRTAHWGMYASGTVERGVQYNDDIRICVLDAPLADLATEPRCP